MNILSFPLLFPLFFLLLIRPTQTSARRTSELEALRTQLKQQQMLLALAFSSSPSPSLPPQLPLSPISESSKDSDIRPYTPPRPAHNIINGETEFLEQDVVGAARVLAGLRDFRQDDSGGKDQPGNRGAWKGGMDVFLGPPTRVDCPAPAAGTASSVPVCAPTPPHPSACCPQKSQPSNCNQVEEDPYSCAQTIPCFTLRDKILKYGKEIDLSALCNELVERAVCHGDPWDPTSWELPEDLFERFPMMR